MSEKPTEKMTGPPVDDQVQPSSAMAQAPAEGFKDLWVCRSTVIGWFRARVFYGGILKDYGWFRLMCLGSFRI